MKQLRDEIRKINHLMTEIDALYHLFAVKFGISDSECTILYTLLDEGGACPLTEIGRVSGIRKQTIHSAIRKLEEGGYLRLEAIDGKSKRVLLTEHGKELAERTVGVLFRAENAAFGAWTSEDVRTYIHLTEKYLRSLNEEIRAL